MMNPDTLPPLSLNQSYQHGWEKSLLEFNSQQAEKPYEKKYDGKREPFTQHTLIKLNPPVIL